MCSVKRVTCNVMKKETYHEELKRLADEYVQKVYLVTKKFPRDEIFGVTSELRRSALSVILNYIEGYARQRKEVLRNFTEISYGSLKERKYLIYFSHKQQYLEKQDHDDLVLRAERIGKMLWGILNGLNKK